MRLRRRPPWSRRRGGKLDESERVAALRLANAEKLAADLDALTKQLAIVRDERDRQATNLALMARRARQERPQPGSFGKRADRDQGGPGPGGPNVDKSNKDLTVARQKTDDLEKMLAGSNTKLTASDAELIKRRGELDTLGQQLELAKKRVTDLDLLVRAKERARTEFESKLKESKRSSTK